MQSIIVLPQSSSAIDKSATASHTSNQASLSKNDTLQANVGNCSQLMDTVFTLCI